MEHSSKLLPFFFLTLLGLVAFEEFDAFDVKPFSPEKNASLKNIHIQLWDKKTSSLLSIRGEEAVWELTPSVWTIQSVDATASLTDSWNIHADQAVCNNEGQCSFRGNVHIESSTSCPTILDTQCLELSLTDKTASSTCIVTGSHDYTHFKSEGITMSLNDETIEAHRNFSSFFSTQSRCQSEQNT